MAKIAAWLAIDAKARRWASRRGSRWGRNGSWGRFKSFGNMGREIWGGSSGIDGNISVGRGDYKSWLKKTGGPEGRFGRGKLNRRAILRKVR